MPIYESQSWNKGHFLTTHHWKPSTDGTVNPNGLQDLKLGSQEVYILERTLLILYLLWFFSPTKGRQLLNWLKLPINCFNPLIQTLTRLGLLQPFPRIRTLKICWCPPNYNEQWTSTAYCRVWLRHCVVLGRGCAWLVASCGGSWPAVMLLLWGLYCVRGSSGCSSAGPCGFARVCPLYNCIMIVIILAII